MINICQADNNHISLLKKSFGLVSIPFLLSISIMWLSCEDAIPDLEYSVYGQITGDTQVDVTIDYEDGQVVSNPDGTYMINDLPPGTYEIRPSKPGFTFFPDFLVVDVIDQNVNDIDFVATGAPGGFTFQNYFFQPLDLSTQEIIVVENTMRLDLTENGLWFQNDQGGLVYTEISGDFTISAFVQAEKSSSYGEATMCDICLGGIMARDPDNSAGENYVHLVTGQTPEGPGVEYKSTESGNSVFTALNTGQTNHELLLCRSEDLFTFYYRQDSSIPFILGDSIRRPDLPEVLQVGFNIYTAESGSLADLSILIQDVLIANDGCVN
jgi:hypothetical protein